MINPAGPPPPRSRNSSPGSPSRWSTHLSARQHATRPPIHQETAVQSSRIGTTEIGARPCPDPWKQRISRRLCSKTAPSTCYLNTTITDTCGQGSVPVIGVDARSVEGHTGCSYVGSTAELERDLMDDGWTAMIFLGVVRRGVHSWCGHINITYNPTSVPQGALANETVYDTVTLAAGVQWHEAYTAVNDYGRLMVGGISVGGSVGSSGGWLAGGRSLCTVAQLRTRCRQRYRNICHPLYGTVLDCNDYQNSDLFWALRGGGGSTYGIVTSVTYCTYPSVPVQFYTYEANITNSSVLSELVGGFLRHQTQFTDDSWGGSGGISDQQLYFFYSALNMTNETAVETTQAWRNFTASLAPFGVVSAEQMQYFPSWYELYQILFSTSIQNGGNVMFTSRLLSRDTVANNYTEVAEILLECGASFNTIAGGKASQFGANSAGLNPAWRNAIVETMCGIAWEDGTSSTEIQGMVAQLKGWVKAMYDVTPTDGAYFNEASLFKINWQETFFGSHYSTLKGIKDTYDPYRLFVVA
ncbi:hypothetical protein J3R83DRAFT_7252 [Lanmaoa asiatica]|nr:hypothetical protein J3R83DRAFT_7252 [Lanmaoa asiatica]